MSDFLEILKYVIPSLVVFLTAYAILKKFLDKEEKKLRYEYNLKSEQFTIPIRLQAYERIILLLERISPESLLLRVNKKGMNSRQLQNELLSEIRTEFDHNLSQQIYISPQAWNVVQNAKSNLIKIINVSASSVNPDSPSMNLSKAILDNIMEAEESPVETAKDHLKKEIRELF